MPVLICHASLDENKNIKGGKAGDQTGKEVCIREWYNRPWNVVLRFKDPDMREKCAVAMEHAAANNHIGYDQSQRNSLLAAVRKCGYDPKKVTKNVETDCSALVTVACIYAGIAEEALVKSGNSATTSTLKDRLKATGEVDIFTSKEYTEKTGKLIRGDILLYEKHHTAVVVKAPTKSNKEIAKEVIQGLWGNGSERKKRLTDAGYDYSEVQKEVNALIKETTSKPLPNNVERYIWNFLYGRIQNPYGVAGLMGNIQAESGLNPKNVQNSYEKKLGMGDDAYTVAVDCGAYKNFCTDLVGYGLCQWTVQNRKTGLYNMRNGRSIGDLDLQLEFLWKELNESYRGVLNGLKVVDTVREASDLVLTKFERPRDQSAAAKSKRAQYGRDIFNRCFMV